MSNIISSETYIVIAVVVSIAVFFYILKTQQTPLAVVALTSIFAGGLQNLVQRVMYKCVLDNISFFGLFVFNIADFLISSGVVLLIYTILKNDKKSFID